MYTAQPSQSFPNLTATLAGLLFCKPCFCSTVPTPILGLAGFGLVLCMLLQVAPGVRVRIGLSLVPSPTPSFSSLAAQKVRRAWYISSHE